MRLWMRLSVGLIVRKKREQAITAEERDRLRREADERRRERCTASAKAIDIIAKEWLRKQGLLLPGDGVGDRLRRLYAYRKSIVQTSAPTYQPTLRQQQARPTPGVIEVEF